MDSNLKVINVLSPENRREYIESLYDIKFPLLGLMVKGEKTISRYAFQNMVDSVKVNKDKAVCDAIDELFKRDLSLKPNGLSQGSDGSYAKGGRVKSLNNGRFKSENDIAA